VWPLLQPAAPPAIPRSVEAVFAEMAGAILSPETILPGKPRDPDLELAANILKASDEFDEAIEFTAYDRTSIPSAIADFFKDAALRFDARVLHALRQITTAKMRLAIPAQLPVLPAATLQLMRMMRTSAETVSVSEVEAIAASDPVLAGRLLCAANSVLFGSRSEISSLRQAVLRLGVPYARKALLAGCCGTLFASASLAKLWNHSKLVAATAHEIAAECGYDQEIAYVAGLLHDVGRIITERCPPKIKVEEHSLLAAGFPLMYAETLMYGTDHAALGADLLKTWQLPFELIDAVGFHHRPESTDSALAGILCLAEFSVATDMPPECLSTNMRSAAACRNAGLRQFSPHKIDRQSAILAIAS
jgi:putative nucleotidyltransferase with HDIG domain